MIIFWAVRSHRCRIINPTSEQFKSATASNVHTPGANSKEDHCVILSELVITREENKKLENGKNDFYLLENNCVQFT